MPREWSLAEPVVKGLLLPFSATVMNLTGNFSTTNSTTNVTTYVPSVVTSGRVSVREGDYVGMWIHLHNLREDREIIAHSQYGSISVSPPFSQLPPMQEPYVIYDIDGLPGGQRRDFDLGTPEFHVQTVSYVQSSTPTQHVGLTRLSSTQFAGGLTATYYSSDFRIPLWSRGCVAGSACDETIDFSLAPASGTRTYGGGAIGTEMTRGWTESLSLPDSEYGVRWSGFVSPTLAGTYTFFVSLFDDVPPQPYVAWTGSDERVKLWIDNSLVLTEWSSLSTNFPLGTFHFEQSYPQAYSISLHYRNWLGSTKSGLKLSWQRDVMNANASVIPSTRLFPLSSRAEASYVATVAGDYQLLVEAAQGPGLYATFYSDLDMMEPHKVDIRDTVDFDTTDEAWLQDPSMSVRFEGLLKLPGWALDPQPALVTFQAVVLETDERVRLWVDQELVIDRWDTYGELAATQFSATMSLSQGDYFALRIDYRQNGGAGGRCALSWRCSLPGEDCAIMGLVPSPSLFRAAQVSGSPFPPHSVLPAPICATASEVSGIGLSSGTAGLSESFMILSLDEYGNEREQGGDDWLVRVIPFPAWNAMNPHEVPRTSRDCIGCTRTPKGEVEDHGDGSYSVTLSATVSGAYKVCARAVSSLLVGIVVIMIWRCRRRKLAMIDAEGMSDVWNMTSMLVQVLTELAQVGGVMATYYDAASVTAFHRLNQTLNSIRDFPASCIFR